MEEKYLAKPEDLATLLGMTATDPRVLLALRRASNRFRDAVGYPVHQVTDDVMWLDGDGTSTLHLPAAPIQAFSVSIDGVTLRNGTDYALSKRIGVARRIGNVWPDGLGNIEVVCSHGWATIPGGIEDAVLEQASVQATALVNVQKQDAGAFSVTYGAQATVGVTTKWTEAVIKYSVGTGDKS